MGRFPVVLRGYDRAQVDALLLRVDGALRGEQQITAEELKQAKFDISLRGYDQRSVDNLLQECVRTLHPNRRRGPAMAGWLVTWIQNAEFSGAGVRTGYDVRDVDAFLDRVVAGLRGAAPAVTAQDVRECAFRPVRWGPAYDEREVDRFLDQLASALEGR